jgi:hypothetical protein
MWFEDIGKKLEAGIGFEPMYTGVVSTRVFDRFTTPPLVETKVLVEENGFEPSGLGFVDPADTVSPPLALSR